MRLEDQLLFRCPACGVQGVAHFVAWDTSLVHSQGATLGQAELERDSRLLERHTALLRQLLESERHAYEENDDLRFRCCSCGARSWGTFAASSSLVAGGKFLQILGGLALILSLLPLVAGLLSRGDRARVLAVALIGGGTGILVALLGGALVAAARSRWRSGSTRPGGPTEGPGSTMA